MIKYFDNTKANIDPKRAAEVRKLCKEAAAENLYHKHDMKLKMASVYGQMLRGNNHG